MHDLKKCKEEALVYVTLSPATLFACFGIALALY
jgi:hypothetical protein